MGRIHRFVGRSVSRSNSCIIRLTRHCSRGTELLDPCFPFAGSSQDSCNKSDCQGSITGEEEGEEEEEEKGKAESGRREKEKMEEKIKAESGRRTRRKEEEEE